MNNIVERTYEEQYDAYMHYMEEHQKEWEDHYYMCSEIFRKEEEFRDKIKNLKKKKII